MTRTSRPAVGRFRPAADRFHSQLDWLNSWHSFSFSHHHDPDWMGFGPLRVINDDTIAAGMGFGMHPHQSMEIITVMVEGELTHEDSMDHHEVLRAGEVQRMSAGSGIVHSEINKSSLPCRLLQIWVEPQTPGGSPHYEQKAFPVTRSWTCLLDPAGEAGAMAIQRQLRLWRSQPQPGDCLELPLAADRRSWLQVINGSITLNGQAMQRGDGLGFNSDQVQAIVSSTSDADLLLFELQ
ncbi:MAG: hypothetical protein CBB79_04460 [Synechococcus sp. TMED19]|nr:MAG: hypothetical protein CBB79_04460 [Synechococcus sp. TMED19]